MDKDKLTIIDLPMSQGQVHIHSDASGNVITGGRIYDYSRSVYKTLDSYEACMADLNASSLDLLKITK